MRSLYEKIYRDYDAEFMRQGQLRRLERQMTGNDIPQHRTILGTLQLMIDTTRINRPAMPHADVLQEAIALTAAWHKVEPKEVVLEIAKAMFA